MAHVCRGTPQHHECTEIPIAANPGPKDLRHPDSLPGARWGEPTTPCAPTASQMDGQSPSLSLLSPTEPPRSPPGPFPSRALLMSAHSRIPSPLRLINLITPLQITGDAKPEGRWSVGAPLTSRGWVLPIVLGPQSTHGGIRGGWGPCQPQDGERGALQPPQCLQHASMGSPWGTSVPRPQSDPMKTILVLSRAVRRDAAGRGGGDECCPPAPDPSDPVVSRR